MAVKELSQENIKDIYPLSAMQEGMFFHWLYDETSRAYFEQMSYRLYAELDADIVKRSLQELFKRYDVLRTVFIRKNVNRVLQVVLTERTIDFYREDISQRKDKEEYIKRYKEEDKKKGFDLTKDVLMRVALFHLDEMEYEFTWSFHHILMDGWCVGMLISQFQEIYQSLIAGRPWRLPPVKPYRVYIQWLEQQDREKAKMYWKNYLEGYNEPVGIPRLHVALPGTGATGEYKLQGVTITLGNRETARLHQMQAKLGVTLNTIVQAAWGILFGKYNGKKDVVFGSVVSGRPSDIDGVEFMVGLFINTVPVRICFDETTTTAQLLSQLQQSAVEGEPHHYFPLVEIQVESEPKQNLLDHIMEFQNYPVEDQIYNTSQNQDRQAPGLRVIHVDVFEQTHYPFNLRITPGNRLGISLEFNGFIFETAFVEKIAANFHHLLLNIPDSEDLQVQALTILSEEEKRQILDDFNKTAVEYPATFTLHELFHQAAEKNPHHTAALFEEEQLTNRELDIASDAWATVLRERGITIGSVVAVMTTRSLEMIVGIMAVVKVGAAYLPIDPAFPWERIRYMLEESHSTVVLTTGDSLFESGEMCLHRELVDLKDQKLLNENSHHLTGRHRVCSSEPAYVIYTSGSTGKSKGVIVEHKNVVNFNKGITAGISFSPGNVMLAITTISFDIFVLEIFLPLFNHLRIVIAGESRQKDPDLLGETIVKYCVNMLQVTPSTLQILVNSDADLYQLKGVKELMVGGEAFPDHLFKNVKAKFNGRIHNMYGPTETTVWSAVKELTNEGCVTIGTPIANTYIYMVDPMFHLQPVGAAGELCIGGDGVARGYLNKPELTSDKFLNVNYKLKTEKEIHMSYMSHMSYIYKTGDLAYWLPDGNIEFLGRLDQQVKIRGFRIEPGEIEIQLVNRDDIKETVVVVKEDASKDKYICAYIVPQPGNSPADQGLREYLAGKLPHYMIPSYFMLLEQIPLTPNGKINRKALPAPDIKDSEARTPPRNELEEKLVGTWSEILGIKKEKLGIDHNFFQVGGHSLKAVVLVSTIHKEFNVKISLAEFFKAPFIRWLSEYIKNAEIDRFYSIGPTEAREFYPLSSAQKRLFFLWQIEESHTAYNMSMVLEWQGPIDKARLESTLQALVSRHESLRTSFHIEDNQPLQRIHKQVKFEIEYYIAERKAQSAERGKQGAVRKEGRCAPCALRCASTIKNFIRPFDLSRSPLLRTGLIKISENKHIFMTDMHHIISDGVSVQRLQRDFVWLYAGKELHPLQLQYKDYSQWQNSEMQKEIMEKQREYWTGEFAGEIPVLQLPIDYPRAVLQSFAGGILEFEFSGEQTRELRSLASGGGGTLFMVLVSLYQVFLSKITGQEDIVIGTPVAGRRHKDLEQIIGNFVNTLALRHHPENGKPFNVFLEEVKQQTLQAFDQQEFPYEDLIEAVGVKRDTSRNPLFDTVFVMHNVDIIGKDADSHMGDTVIKPFSYHNKTTKFDLTLGIIESREKLFFNFEYCTELYKSSTIQRFAAYFKEIVRWVSENSAVGLGEIEIMPEEEKQHLLAEFNNTNAHYPEHKTIHQLFKEQVEKTPDHFSVVFEDNALTYKELDRKSNHLAHYLRNNYGLKPEEPVGVLMHRSEHVIVSMLSTLKAGGVYIPIDPDYPESRINYILEDSSVGILVSTVSKVSKVSQVSEVIEVNSSTWDSPLERGASSAASIGGGGVCLNLQSTAHPSNLAYIIYTSGSTGKPKGVLVEHRSVVRLFFHQGCLFDFNSKDIWTMFHSPCFDFSVWEMYGALFYGGKVIVVPKMTASEPAKFLELLKTRVVTVLNQTPTAFYSLAAEALQHNHKHLHLKYVIFGGEALHPLKLQEWKHKYPDTRLINMFGITETTVHVTFKELEEKDIRQDVRYIGKPIPTLSTYIVDRHLGLAPTGITGELCVGGAGVARGYLNRVVLTAEGFIENPFQPGERLYRSGDLARTIETEDVEYLGRKDHQVQLRGFRVELGEIENQLIQHTKIKEACVIDRENSVGDTYLCAYIVSAGDLEIPGMREYLAERLPDYMIPSYFVQLSALPLTPNGKINRKTLPEPGKGKTGNYFDKPRDEVEKKLAEIWSKVLGMNSSVTDIDANFFELGGHSLKAGVLTAAIHKEMNVKLPLTEVFITPNIRGMAEFIRKAKKDDFLSIMPTGKKDCYPLSSAQRRLHIMQQVNPDITAYNITIIQVVEGKLDSNKLENAFRQLIKRHESLRTSFETIEDEPVQKIHQHVGFDIEYYSTAGDIEGTGGLAPLSIEPTAPGLQLITSTIKNFIRPFDLSQPPLLRVGLMETNEKEHILMVDMHHIITDGVSANVLIRDFAVLYEGKSLPGLRLQYKDFSQWQNSEPMKKTIANQKKHWLNQFASDIPKLNLTTDYARPVTRAFEGNNINFVIGNQLNHRLKELIRETGATLFMVLLAAYNILVSRYSQQEDIVVGTPITGRRHADLQNIVGMFVNMLALRNRPAGNKTFRVFLAEVKQNALQAYENQDYQFEQLIIDLDLQGTRDRNPLFDVVFAMQKIDIEIQKDTTGDFKGFKHLRFTPYTFMKKTTPFDLLMAVFEMENTIDFTLTYSTHLFKPSTTEIMTRHYIEVLEQVTADKDIELQDIQLSHQMIELESQVILQDEGEFGF